MIEGQIDFDAMGSASKIEFYPARAADATAAGDGAVQRSIALDQFDIVRTEEEL